MKLKVCGMRDLNNIEAIAALAPAYMGFIFYKNSRRFVGEAFKLPLDFPQNIRKVGVFVNENEEVILKKVEMYQLDFVQLHGNEPAELCNKLKMKHVGVIKVFSVDASFDFEKTVPYAKALDYFMFDTRVAGYGGSGITFDWDLLKKYNQEIPFFLSGGLSPQNIDAALELEGLNIHALDINSGVEIVPGIKDVDKVDLIGRRIGGRV